jgi:histidinol-phosphatase
LPLVELVRGEVDAFLAERHHLWDHAPWILLVEEAGGRFTDRTGGRAGDQGGGLYSNAALHDGLLAALGYPQR